MARSIVRFATGISARLVQLLTGLISVLIVVRLMEPEELGRFYLCYAVAIASCLSLLSPLHFPIQRIMPNSPEERQSFLSSLARIPFRSAIGTTAICGVLLAFVRPAEWVSIALATLVLTGAEVMFCQGTNVTSALRQQGIYFLAVSLRAAMILGLLLALRPTGISATSALLVYAASAFLPFLLFSKEFRQACVRSSDGRDYLRRSFEFGWPYILSQSLRQCVERGDRFIVAMVAGVPAAGQYAVAVDLCRRVLQGITINARLTFVRDAVDAQDAQDIAARDKALAKISNSVGMVGIPLAATVAVFGQDFIRPLLGDKFSAEALSILPICAFAFLIEAYKLYVHVLPFELAKRARLDTIVAGIGLLVQTPLIFLLGKEWGLKGVALALLSAQASMLVAAYLISSRRIGFSAPVVRASAAGFLASCLTVLALNAPWIGDTTSWALRILHAAGFAIAACVLVAAALLIPTSRKPQRMEGSR